MEPKNKPHSLDTEKKLSHLACLEQIINQSDSIAYIRERGANHNVLFISQNISQKTGYVPEDFYQKKALIQSIIHPDDLRRLRAEKHFIETKKQTNGRAEYRLISNKGDTIWVSDVYEIIRNDQDEIIRFQGILTDIGVQKENEEKNIAQHRIIELRNRALLQLNERMRIRTDELNTTNLKLEESESKFKVISEQSQFGILILQHGKIQYFNQAFVKLTPFSKEEISKWGEYEYLNFIHLDDLERVKRTVKDLMQSEENKEFHFEFKKISVDHVTSWYSQWSKIIKYEGERAILVILQDITVQRKWQDALAESENRLRAKLDFILSPDKPIGDFMLTDIFELDQLQKIQDTFAHSNNVASLITDTEGVPITQPSNFSPVCKLVRNSLKGSEMCMQSNKRMGQQAREALKPFTSNCLSCGFLSAGAPIIVGGKHIANWMIGQTVKSNLDENQIRDFAKTVDIDPNKLINAFYKMSFIEASQFDKIVEFLWLLAKDLSAMGYNNLKLARALEERKKIDYALRESEELYRQLVHTSPDGIALINLEGKMIYTSPKCKVMFGYPEDYPTDELNIFEFIHPSELEWAIVNFSQLKSTPSANSASYTMVKRDKTLFTAEVNSAMIHDYHGNPKGMISILRDVTERKKAEEELVNAKNRAEESDKLKSAFLANMSHEIRTPMNGILGFANLLNETETTVEEAREYIDIINQNGNALLKLIDDILDIARLEAGQLKIIENPCFIDHLLYEQYTLFKALVEKMPAKDIDLVLKFPEERVECRILADNGRLKQVLTNLLTNAIKFTEIGSIEFGYEIESPEMLRFYVRDTGIGLPADKLEIIFDRFRQADESRVRKYGGTGLGLAISTNLIKLMGGKIWAESVINEGSVFQFTIPLKPLAEKLTTPGPIEAIPFLSEKFNWKNKYILVVEDEHNNFRFLYEMLKGTKANILHAKNGREAIELCKKNDNIDIVLMDIRMPEINGCTATTEIKKFRKSLPIIAQSAYAMPHEVTLCLEAGCDDYISKPIDHHKLLEKINQFMREL